MPSALTLLLMLFGPGPDAAKPAAESPAVVASPTGAHRSQPMLAGGGVVQRTQELIELIQATVAPDSWIANPGVGIMAFPGGFGPAANAGAVGAGANPGGMAAGVNRRTTNLIKLIQTIEPASWEINGGRGVILPFGP